MVFLHSSLRLWLLTFIRFVSSQIITIERLVRCGSSEIHTVLISQSHRDFNTNTHSFTLEFYSSLLR